MKILAVIEKGTDGQYSIYSDNTLMNHGLGGYGSSVEKAKADFFESIKEAKQMIQEEKSCLPENLKDITVEFRYDLPSFFNCFDWINVSKFAKRIGINESLMRQYKSGIASASEATMKRILAAVKEMAAELQAVTM